MKKFPSPTKIGGVLMVTIILWIIIYLFIVTDAMNLPEKAATATGENLLTVKITIGSLCAIISLIISTYFFKKVIYKNQAID